MKKIGILTFATADNYGAVLQAYALKYSLLNMGNPTHVINFYYPKTQRVKQFFYGYRPSIKWFVRRIFSVLFRPIGKYYRQRYFGPFRKKYLEDTPPVFSKDLPALSKKYDLFITGSDQIFNPRLTEFDTDFFLAFSQDTSKNASYAASFGLELDQFVEKEKAFIRTHLAHLAHISVREKQGKTIIQTLAPERSVGVHIDPTLLFAKSAWEQIAVCPVCTQKYALLYLMHHNEPFARFAKDIAAQNGWTLVTIPSQTELKDWRPLFHKAPTVQEWIGLFLNAQYVFTNSFHGLAFAINFNKPFLTAPLKRQGDASSRLNNLLETVGLQQRRFDPSVKQSIEKPIDWNAVNKVLAIEREKAFTYLQEITK